MNIEEKREALIDKKYPLSAKYDPDWILENEMGSQCLWLVEALAQKMNLKPGMRVLDMGCGKAMTSIFLAKEFGVQVFANDLWISQNDNWKRIREAGVEDLVIPINAEAHALPYADNFFDAIICVNSYQFYGTADNYFNDYLCRLVKNKKQIAFAIPGFKKEFHDEIPEELVDNKYESHLYFHSPKWWEAYFKKSGMVNIEMIDEFDNCGSDIILKWEPIVDRTNAGRNDNGKNFTWIRIILNRK